MSKNYIKINEFETTQLEDEWIVLNTENFTITTLNEVGGYCWSLLDEIQSVESLSERVMDKFSPPVEKDTITNDIDEFLSRLIECGLIKSVV